ncbi:MAG: hypothetical protein H8E36_15255 [Rhodospirillaceae bacterium]|nr:hypothetical protein [Rhodospirillaceae bacterium]MBL6929897.1 hypothetical protein [Rhodospirillales bacterium]MBL6941617.1 hypothetical protein [Rhodospirillales bacterium]
MRAVLVTCTFILLLSACTTPEPVQPLEIESPGCAGTARLWDHEHTEILHLNPGYAYHQIDERAAFLQKFNAMPPKTERPVPDTIGYFSKPGNDQSILVFVIGDCVTYLEVVSLRLLRETFLDSR